MTNSDLAVSDLEKAILKRAETLAAEYMERAQRSRERIMREARDNLRLREDHEVQVSKQLAERDYARRIQSSELKYQRKLDMLRWSLVQGVMGRLQERLQAFAAEQSNDYLQLLAAYLREGVENIKADELVVELNADDHRKLSPQWAQFTQDCAGGCRLTLHETPVDAIGGLLIRTTDNRIRVDNRFEGRLERLEAELHQVIMERMFSSVEELQGFYHG